MERPILYGQVNLQKYLDSMIITFEGEDGIFIPFKHNPSIYVGHAGVFANLVVRKCSNRYGYDYSIAASVKKSIMDTLTEAERRLKSPFLGNFRKNDGMELEEDYTPEETQSPFKKEEDEPVRIFNDTSVLDKCDEIEDLPL